MTEPVAAVLPHRGKDWPAQQPGAGTVSARWLSLLAIALLALAGQTRDVQAQARPIVYVVPIEGMIDMGLAPFVQRTLAEARRADAAAVILEINTFGGRVDAAVVIRDALLSTPLQTVAFVNRRAISAGALISLAAGKIAMADGGTIGAATPVQAGAPGSTPGAVEEKSVSYLRSEFRATADSRGRSPEIAEAMVDADVEIPGIIEEGKLLTLTTAEALRHGLADFRADGVDDVLAQLEIAGAELRYTSPNWGERLVRLITHPLIASLLLSIAMIGILIEIRTPGFGVPGALGVASLALLIGGHWIVELVGWEQVLLIGVGLALLGLEVFVIPGFGVAGIAGSAAVLAGITMALVGQGATVRAFAGAAGRIAVAMMAALVVSAILWRFLPRTALGRRLMLDTELTAAGGYESALERERRWIGRAGRTISPLRPSGYADIDGERVDVVSDGDMIEADAPIVVSRVDGNRIVVRRQPTSPEGKSK